MGMHVWVLVVALVCIAPAKGEQKKKANAASPQRTELTARQRELVELQRGIEQRQRQLNQLLQREQATLRAIQQLQDLVERQRRLLRLLEEQVHALTERERALQQERGYYGAAYDRELARLERLIVLLVGAESEEDATVDTAVAAIAARQLQSRLRSVRQQRDSTDRVLTQVRAWRVAREALVAKQKQEQQRLERLLALRAALLEQLRRDRRAAEQELNKLRQSIQAIERTIERMSGKAMPKSGGGNTASLPVLIPPVQGAILRGYGEYRHPLTGVKAYNPGVDIAVPAGTSVRAAAAGRVMSVQWLPAMNTVVIIEHSNSVRTVYGNLEHAAVRSGMQVSAGQPIGTSGESLSGAFVHFELWRGKERLDPTFVLR
ncbi:MAG: peptidoglycan DD-metalloendopeptidase family protein [Candidatus Kapabacteria bacterium]|nr:peptidoglycan DD-metalloendopeptidase family protein [Candidatus Kapabacteria bacterium]